MKPLFQHDFVSSFHLWLDNYVLTNGEAYKNKTGTLYPYEDSRMPSAFNVFASPFKQWVSDSSVVGATVPTGVFFDGVEQYRSDGVSFDFANGRVLSSGMATPATVTGAFSVKDFNIYYTNETEEDLIVDKKYKPNHHITDGTETGIDPYDQNTPAIFLTIPQASNEEFCFGGMDKSTIMPRVVVLAETPYQLDGALSLFADANSRTFRTVSFEDYPFTVYGDLKGGAYNYNDLATGSMFYIDGVVVSKLSDRIKRSLLNDLYIGFADFEVSTHRYPRS